MAVLERPFVSGLCPRGGRVQCFVSRARPDTLRYKAPRVLGYKAAIANAESAMSTGTAASPVPRGGRM